MNALDRATQAEIRIATMYVTYKDTERLVDPGVAGLPDQFGRNDRFMAAMSSACAELGLDITLIFEVAKEIRDEAEQDADRRHTVWAD